ncbi:MAG: hypothetical protein R2801_00220 [Chitinophagales bacterium]
MSNKIAYLNFKCLLIVILTIMVQQLNAQSFNLTAPIGNSNYQWYNASGAISGATSNTLTNVQAAGLYYAEYTPVGKMGCSKKTDLFILLSRTTSCGDTNMIINAGTVTTLSATYQWYKNGVLLSGETGSTLSVSAADTGLIYAKVAPLGCDTIETEHFIVKLLNLDTTTNYYALCYGDSIIVGSSVYKTGGTFTDVLTNINGCDSIINSIITLDLCLTDTLPTLPVCDTCTNTFLYVLDTI